MCVFNVEVSLGGHGGSVGRDGRCTVFCVDGGRIYTDRGGRRRGNYVCVVFNVVYVRVLYAGGGIFLIGLNVHVRL